MIVRELVTKLGFTLEKAKLQRAEQAFERLHAQAKSINKALLYLGGAATAAFTGLLGIAKSTAEAGDEALKTSQKIGVSVESFQRLAYAGKLADISSEGLATSLKFLSKNMVSAVKDGGETAKAFKSIGIDPKKYLNDTEGLLLAVADRISKMPDGARKTALSLELMGKSGSEMIPFLNAGGNAIRELGDQAQRYGLVIGKEAAQRSEVFNDRITEFTEALKGLRNTVGSRLIPVLDEQIKRILDWYGANQELVKSKVNDWVNKLYRGLVQLYGVGVKVINFASSFIDKLGGLENAAKLAAWAIGLIYASKVLTGFYSLASGIASIITGLKGVQAGAMLAYAKIFAIPALVLAVGLAIGTAIGYVFNRWEKFKQAFVNAAYETVGVYWDVFSALFEFLKNGFMETAAIAFDLLNPMKFLDAIDRIKSGAAFEKTKASGAKLLEADKNLRNREGGLPGSLFFREFSKNISPTISKDMDLYSRDLKNLLNFGGGNLDAMLRSSPELAMPKMMGLPAMPAAPVANNNTTVKANVKIQLPDGSVRKEIEKAVVEAVYKAIRLADPTSSASGA